MTQGEQTAYIIIGIAVIVLFVLTVIAGWKIFKKAGEPGWKALIPIYNGYVLMKIVGMKAWFWVLLLLSCVTVAAQEVSHYYPSWNDGILSFDFAGHPVAATIIAISELISVAISVFYAIRTAKVFGHGLGYTIGLLIFPNIFLLILGFGKSKYSKKALKEL